MPLCKNKTNRETKNQNMLGFGVALREDKAGTQGIRRYLRRVNPPGDDRELGAGKVQQRRGANSHGKWQQTQEYGAGHRDGRQRLAGGNCG